MERREGGLAGLLADHPDAHPYVDDGGRLNMWPVAPPSSGAYRLATSPGGALAAMRDGDAPVLWEHADVPDPDELLAAIADQWTPREGEPIFQAPPGGGFQANAAHPLWQLLRDRE